MRQVRYPIHLNLDRNGYLLFDLFRCPTRPLRDDVDVVVGHIRISFHGQAAKRDGPPDEQKNGNCQDDEAIVQSEIDETAQHRAAPRRFERDFTYCSTVFCRTNALLTTCCPGCSPDVI